MSNAIIIPEDIRKTLSDSQFEHERRASKLTRLVPGDTLRKWMGKPPQSVLYEAGLFTAALQEPVAALLPEDLSELYDFSEKELYAEFTRLIEDEVYTVQALRILEINPFLFSGKKAIDALHIVEHRTLPTDPLALAGLLRAAKAMEEAETCGKNILNKPLREMMLMCHMDANTADAAALYCEGNTMHATAIQLDAAELCGTYRELARRIRYTDTPTEELVCMSATCAVKNNDYELVRELYSRVGFRNKTANEQYAAFLQSVKETYGAGCAPISVVAFLADIYMDIHNKLSRCEGEAEIEKIRENKAIRKFILEDCPAFRADSRAQWFCMLLCRDMGLLKKPSEKFIEKNHMGSYFFTGAAFAGKVFATAQDENTFVEIPDDAVVYRGDDDIFLVDKVKVIEIDEENEAGVAFLTTHAFPCHTSFGVLHPGEVVDFYDFVLSPASFQQQGFGLELVEEEEPFEI